MLFRSVSQSRYALEENIFHNMPMINGVPQEGFREPQEIKTGGLIQGKPKLALRGWK